MKIEVVCATVALAASLILAAPHVASAEASATCSGTGQDCDGYVTVSVDSPNKPVLLSLTAPKAHCSNIIYIVKYFQPGDQLAMKVYAETERLAPGQNAQMRLNIPAKQIRIYARGVQGGCNQGRLASWSVEAEVGPLLH